MLESLDPLSQIDFIEKINKNFNRNSNEKETEEIYSIFSLLQWMKIEGLYRKDIFTRSNNKFQEKNKLDKQLFNLLHDGDIPIKTCPCFNEDHIGQIKIKGSFEI